MDSSARWYFSAGVLAADSLTGELRRVASRLAKAEPDDPATGVDSGFVVSTASELLGRNGRSLPIWSQDLETRYLIVVDVPVSAILELPSILRLRKPHLRMHVSEGFGSVRRLVVAQCREDPLHGIVDAYLVAGTLKVVVGDLSVRDFPVDDIDLLTCMDRSRIGDFKIDVDGSFLSWDADGIDVGVSQLLKEVDPSHFARLEIERLQHDRTGRAIAEIREECGLRQADIEGLSERQVRRIEKSVSRLTVDAAEKLSHALGTTLGDFLAEVARRAGDPERAAAKKGRSEEVRAESRVEETG